MHRADSLTGFGNRPDFTPSNQLVFPSGITLSTCGKRKNPVSGISCMSHYLPFHSHITIPAWRMSRTIALAASLSAMLRCTSDLRDLLAPSPRVCGPDHSAFLSGKSPASRYWPDYSSIPHLVLSSPSKKAEAKESSFTSRMRAPAILDLSQRSFTARHFSIALPYPGFKSACFSFPPTSSRPQATFSFRCVQKPAPAATRQTAFTRQVFPRCEASVSHVAAGTCRHDDGRGRKVRRASVLGAFGKAAWGG
jgi:hypothetical protein